MLPLVVLVDRFPKNEQEQTVFDQLCKDLSITSEQIFKVNSDNTEILEGKKVLLALGEDSLEYILGIRGLSKTRGKILYSDRYDAKIVTSFSYHSLLPKKNRQGEILAKESARVQNETRMYLSDINVAKSLCMKEESFHRYELVLENEREKFDRLVEKLKTLDLISVDIEAHEEPNWDVEKSRLLGIGFSWKPGTGVYVVLRDQWREIDPEEYKYRTDKIREILSDPKIKKVIHNCNYEVSRLKYILDCDIENMEDSMLMHHLYDENTRHGLDNLSDVFSPDLAGYKDETDIFIAKGDSFSNIPTGILGRRCCADCDLALRIYLTLINLLQEQQLMPLYSQITMPHRAVLTEGEMVGTKVDIDELNRIDPIIKEKVVTLKSELCDLVEDSAFNPNSYIQVRKAFGKFGIPLKVDRDGKITTDVDAVKEIIAETDHDFPKKLLKFRQFSKLYSTYIQGIRSRLLPGNIIHTSFLVHGTVTGRLSSQNPNLQNMPTDVKMIDDYGLPSDISIRKLFVPRKDHKFICSDGSQMELRLLAVLSGDKVLSEAFFKGEDIHTLTAFAIISGTRELYEQLKANPNREDLKAKWGKIRAIAKNVNFGIAYGRQAPSLAQELKISVREAQSFLDGFFDQYTGVYTWIQETIGFAKKNGYVLNLFGRRRRLPDIYSPNQWRRAEAERQAQNSPIQSSAADCTAVANIRSARSFKTHNLIGGFRINIHDELVYEVHERHVEKGQELIRRGWLDPIPRLTVPLDVQVSVGDRWEH